MTAPQLAPGTVVAQKYQLRQCLGYAGSSATYLAVGPDGREAVLKIFDPAIRQRGDIMGAIEQTYAATNALPQDLAAPLLDAGYDPATGAPFSVGERIPFPSLAQLAAQRPLAPEEVSSLLGVLGQLLDQSHARQLFHHALKPTNVFVGLSTGQGIRVTDFGAGLARTAVPSQEGYALAAPWLAPEQVQGQVPAGAAADVFAVGLMMFFALTGRSYWRSCQGTIDLPGWQRELLAPRTPPSARALQLGVQLNSAFDGVLGCALSIDPGQRYRSVSELARAFEPLVSVPAPESQATMAFPASAIGFQPGGGYPPPPAPSGGYAAVPPAAGAPAASPAQPQRGAFLNQSHTELANPFAIASQGPAYQQAAAAQGQQPMGAPQGYAAPPAPMGAPPQQAPAPQVQAQANPAYVSTQSAPAQAQGAEGPLGETAAGRPIDPAVMARRAPPNRMAPILVGLVAVVLLGGAAAAWVVMGKRSRTDTTASASASASASAAPAGSGAPAADTASAAPAETASAAPADSASAAPSDSASAAPAPSGEPSAAPAATDSTLACDPECDEIKVDDKAIEFGKPVAIAPGKHTLTATKNGYVTVKETVLVKAGEKLERTFKMKEKPTAPAGTGATAATTGPAKPCGKFLKRGAGCK